MPENPPDTENPGMIFRMFVNIYEKYEDEVPKLTGWIAMNRVTRELMLTIPLTEQIGTKQMTEFNSKLRLSPRAIVNTILKLKPTPIEESSDLTCRFHISDEEKQIIDGIIVTANFKNIEPQETPKENAIAILKEIANRTTLVFGIPQS